MQNRNANVVTVVAFLAVFVIHVDLSRTGQGVHVAMRITANP